MSIKLPAAASPPQYHFGTKAGRYRVFEKENNTAAPTARAGFDAHLKRIQEETQALMRKDLTEVNSA